MEQKQLCEVCRKNESIGVASSGLVAMSNAFCRDCLIKGAEPYGNIVSTLYIIGRSWEENVDEYLSKIIEVTLEITGKTMEQLREDVNEALKAEEEYLLMMEKMEDEFNDYSWQEIDEEIERGLLE